MSKVVEPLHEKTHLVDYFDEETKRVLIIFWHGLGDLVMFLNPYYALKEQYPDIEFDIALAEGLDQETIIPEAILITGNDLKDIDLNKSELSNVYDIIAKIHFPMSENQTEFTKAEFCCIHELGINPVCSHKQLVIDGDWNRLVAVHFNITCLPDAANPDRETAEKIWDEILQAGYIPIETHFQHVFHNPVNKKFDFVDCHVRRVQPRISTLLGLLNSCRAFIGVVSGNYHCALAIYPPERIFFLEKMLRHECFSKLPVARASIRPNEYIDGSVYNWLMNLK